MSLSKHMDFDCTCMYCGHEWTMKLYGKDAIKSRRCVLCNDSFIKVRNVGQDKVDYYVGCPPFASDKVEKVEEEEDFEEFYNLANAL